MVDRWLIVGLGNPEANYAGTRHNLGADVVRRLAERLGVKFRAHKVGGLVADAQYRPPGSEPVALSLMVPFGYMNESGGPVQSAMAFYKLPHERLVVVHDEIDLEFGVLRLKRGGGTAGHNGLRDVQRRIGSADFHRVRIGVGRPPGRQDPAAYVLKRFPSSQREDIDVTIERATDALLALVTTGLEATQNRFH